MELMRVMGNFQDELREDAAQERQIQDTLAFVYRKRQLLMSLLDGTL
jgi:hypothetical protein